MKNTYLKFNSLTLYFLLISLLSGYIKYSLYSLFIVLFHELGHIFIIKLLGYKISMIEIFPFGGICKINKKLNDSIIKDILIALFGIIFQIILLLFIKDEVFTKINITILLFNLLPIIPLDGSKILIELLSIIFPYKKVLNIYPIISLVFIFIYVFYCKSFDNILIINLFAYKTLEMYKNKNIFYSRFILEKIVYDIKYNKVNNNKKISDYKKDTKYYYFDRNHIIDEKEYLKSQKY